MKPRFTKTLSLTLAGILQLAPVIRTVLPSVAAPTGALILRWIAGGIALMGFDAISSATSISTPPTATNGIPYSATIAYNGGFSGNVKGVSLSNNCFSGSVSIGSGLTMTYTSGYTLSVSGTPSGAGGVLNLPLTFYDISDCNAGNEHYSGTTSLVINTGGAANLVVPPQNVLSEVGENVVLSGAATGTPTPQYYWKQGISFIPGATNATLTITNAQLTNSGAYTLIASNSAGSSSANCIVTMAQTPASLIYLYTNYIVAGTPVTMMSLITNVPAASNGYSWKYDSVAIGVTTPNLTLSGAQTIPAKSGTYTVVFSSTNAGTVIVSNQYYDSYWQFGFLPAVNNQPSPVTTGVGSNATFNVTLAGSTYPTLLWYQNATNLVAVQTSLTNTYNPSLVTATTNLSLTISNVTLANAGNYTVVITNFWGSTTSSIAALTVTGGAPTVTSPLGATNYAGKNVSLTVTGSGAGPLGYQWQKNAANLSNGGTISGATTNTLNITPAQTSDSGNYRVVVTNSSGSVTSSVAPLLIVPVPQFAIAVVSNATLTAAGGVPGANYVVQFNTNLLSSNSWVNLKTNVVPAGGVISFTDTNLATLPRGYYRVQF